MDIKNIIGYVSGIITVSALVIYIIAIVKGKVYSNKIAWGIWALVSAMLFFSYYKSVGFVSNIWVSFAYFVGVSLIFIFLHIYTQKGVWTIIEKMSLIGVVIILIMWIIFQSSTTALFLTLLIDILGAVPLVAATYHDPKSEFGPAWYLAFAANGLNLLAVEKWDYVNAIYPMYLAIMTLTVSILIFFPSMRFGDKNKEIVANP